MTVAVVTPWYEHVELWPDYKQVIDDGRPDQLLIIDNGSQPALSFANVRLQTNRGFCYACNTGLWMAKTDAVVFLNNDVALADGHGWLDRILHALEPGVLVGAWLRSDPHTAINGQVIPYLDGWCLAGITEELIDLGGFDESLTEPAYYSDNLLCLEARAAGFTLREAPTGLTHKGTVTARPDDAVHATAANRDLYINRAVELMAPAHTGGTK